MRIVSLCVLFIVSYLVAVVVLFPAAPVVEYFKPQIGLVSLEGVTGKLYKGMVGRLRSTDDLLPLEFENVGWALAPATLLKGGAGASFRFDGYGGDGEGLVQRQWNGDIVVSDFRIDALAKTLEPLLPVPIASFSGKLAGTIDQLSVVNNLLNSVQGKLTWSKAVLETPVAANLGTVELIVKPDGQQTHVVSLRADGGDVAMDGTITLAQNGDFASDVLLTPSPSASPALLDSLRQMGRADNKGRIRIQQQGNVNRLM